MGSFDLIDAVVAIGQYNLADRPRHTPSRKCSFGTWGRFWQENSYLLEVVNE
jgi:hypothetical protein